MNTLDSATLQLLDYNDKLESRPFESIDLVVIHCTELPDLKTAREYGERVLYASGTGNSGHLYVDRDGSVFQYVTLDRVAHHVRGHNAHSVGIELVNRGRYPEWHDSRRQTMDEAYPQAQIDALVSLVEDLRRRLPALEWITGHEDLDRSQIGASDDASVKVPYKMDPGPMFPWDEVLDRVPLRRYRD